MSSRCKRALCLANKLKLRFFKEIFNKAYLREKCHKSTKISNLRFEIVITIENKRKKLGFLCSIRIQKTPESGSASL